MRRVDSLQDTLAIHETCDGAAGNLNCHSMPDVLRQLQRRGCQDGRLTVGILVQPQPMGAITKFLHQGVEVAAILVTEENTDEIIVSSADLGRVGIVGPSQLALRHLHISVHAGRSTGRRSSINQSMPAFIAPTVEISIVEVIGYKRGASDVDSGGGVPC